MTIRIRTDPDGTVEESRTFEWTEQTSGEGVVANILAWASSLGPPMGGASA